MGKESEDKAERILSMYSRLKQGKVIFKEKESMEYNVSPRTIQRDIADIQCFLQNDSAENGEVSEIIFDKKAGGYVLQTKQKSQLEGKEILVVAKVLLESRSLMKDELFPIINKLIGLCTDESDVKAVDALLKNELHHYVELHHKQLLLDRIWKLQQAVKNQCYIEVKYQKLKNKEIVTRKLKPVGVMFSDFYFYLTAFIDDIDKEEKFQNPNDMFPTIYRIDRFLEINLLKEHFSVPYADRFEEGKFRKRVQFMYGGRLRRVRLTCDEICLEAVLDKLPTAEILRIEDGKYVLLAEVFGDGIDMWIKSQMGHVTIGGI